MKNRTYLPKTNNRWRKGVAIEMAVAVLMILFVLCSLLISFSLIQVKELDRAGKQLQERILLDQIGEQFCAAVSDHTVAAWSGDSELYTTRVHQTEKITLTVTDKAGTVVLSIVLEPNAEGYTVKKWSYQ